MKFTALVIALTGMLLGCASLPQDRTGIGEVPNRPPVVETADYEINVEKNSGIVSFSLPESPMRICIHFELPSANIIVGMQWKENSRFNLSRSLCPGRKKYHIKGDYYWDAKREIVSVYLYIPCIYMIDGDFTSRLEILIIDQGRNLKRIEKKLLFHSFPLKSSDMSKDRLRSLRNESKRTNLKRISKTVAKRLEELKVLK